MDDLNPHLEDFDMRTLRFSTLCGGMALAVAAAACGDEGTGPGDAVTVAGQWRGTALLPNGRTTTMTLQQTGSAISGQMSVAGAFVGGSVTGQVNSANRTFTWVVGRGCEAWGGVLNVDPAGRQMSGALLIDRSACQPAQANGTGTLSMTRE
jgi:hypothetical protein